MLASIREIAALDHCKVAICKSLAGATGASRTRTELLNDTMELAAFIPKAFLASCERTKVLRSLGR